MRKFIYTVFTIGLLSNVPEQSRAWGLLGHRVVGEIAQSYLTPKAKKEIEQILGPETLAMASNWADFIRSDTNYKHLSPMHYIDFDTLTTFDEFKAELKTDTTVDAYTQITFLTTQLKNKNLPKYKKIMYLRLLIHFVGDIHQPFHVSREGDSGGNGFRVSWFGANSNIHRVWDEQLPASQDLSYTEYTNAINHATLTQVKTWQKQPLSKWLYDSFVLSEGLRKKIVPEEKLGYKYIFDNLEIMNAQLLKGGVHLAGLLNQIFS